MQPSSSREMQGMNSILNQSQMSLQDLHHHHQNQNQIQPSSHDDFLEQVLSTINTSCSWPDLKSPWDLNPSNPSSINGHGKHAAPDLSSDEIPASDRENASFPFDEPDNSLALKLRGHQISGSGTNSPAMKAAAAMMLHQQLLMSRGGISGDPDLLPPMPMSLNGGDMELSQNDVVDGPSSFKSPTQGGAMQAPKFGATGPAASQGPVSGPAGGAPGQPKQRVRARRGQATDPHSIAERLRRERIAERMKALQELVPNANKIDKASMLDEIIDYVKFLQLQVKVLSMSRLGGAAAVAPLVADMSSEGGGDCVQSSGNTNGGGVLTRGGAGGVGGFNPASQAGTTDQSMTVTEHQVAKLMEEDMGSAMQYLQGKGLCLMPISLATAISTATCNSRNPTIGHQSNHPLNIHQSNGAAAGHQDGPPSPSLSILTVQSATVGNCCAADASGKDNASNSKS